MAYSSRTDLALVRRAMRAGARDYLTEPAQPETVKEAFARISTRGSYRPKEPGKLMVFVSAKRGVGTTNIAANYAIALTKESRARVVVVDLDLQLGDLALGLGLTASCSIADALSNPTRLDREFLATLLARHESGLAVLGSADDFRFSHIPDDNAADKLFSILCEEFDYVVVDTGTCHGHVRESLLAMAHTLYIVTERNFPALRNANRLVSHLAGNCNAMHVELVLNRFDAPHSDISEDQARKAIGRPINWRIPDGHAAVQKAWDKGVPLVLEGSPMASVLVQMARTACGKPQTVVKASRMFSFFDWKTRAESVT
jgi:pilus assembly protein CpaE